MNRVHFARSDLQNGAKQGVETPGIWLFARTTRQRHPTTTSHEPPNGDSRHPVALGTYLPVAEANIKYSITRRVTSEPNARSALFG